MAIQIDWTGALATPPYRAKVTIPQADLTFVSGTLYELDVRVFWEELKAREDDEDGIVFPDLQDHFSAYTIAGVTYADAVFLLCQVQFEDTGSQYSVRLAAANTDLFDVENDILQPTDKVTVIGNNSAGLVIVNTVSDTLETKIDALIAAQDLTNEQKAAEHVTIPYDSLNPSTTGKLVLRNTTVMRRWEADAYQDAAKTIRYAGSGMEAVDELVEVAWS